VGKKQEAIEISAGEEKGGRITEAIWGEIRPHLRKTTKGLGNVLYHFPESDQAMTSRFLGKKGGRGGAHVDK